MGEAFLKLQEPLQGLARPRELVAGREHVSNRSAPPLGLAGEDQEYLVLRELVALRRRREPGPREAQAGRLREIYLQPPGARLRGAHRTTHHALRQVQIERIELQGDGLGRHAELVPLNRDTSLREASGVYHRRRAAPE